MIKIVDKNNLPVEKAIENYLQKVLQKIQKSGKLISDALKFTTQRHFQTIYPGSKHYNPKKVTNDKSKDGSICEGSINIDVPGITRAFRNLTIRPVKARALTIPLHREAYGKRASQFSDLFVVHKKNGKSFLARSNTTGGITMMYLLAKSAFQKKDKRLLPSDETYSNNIFSRMKAYLQRTKI